MVLTTDQSGQAMPIPVVIGLGMVTALREEIVPGANSKTKPAISRKKLLNSQ